MRGIGLGSRIEDAGNPEIDKGELSPRKNDIGRLQVTVDQCRLEALVQFPNRFADLREHLQRKLGRSPATVNHIAQGFTMHEVHKHHALVLQLIAGMDARYMLEYQTRLLGIVDSLIRRT